MRALAVIMISFAIMCIIFVESGFRLNITKSLAPGVYRIVSGIPIKGDYAWFCPPDNSMLKEAKMRGYINAGSCHGGYTHFMKMVAAAKGDIVTINEKGVFINSIMLPFSKPFKKDGKGRELTTYKIENYEVKENEYIMMTDCSEKSFDARYFGVVKGVNIKKLIKVITWSNL